MTKQEKGSDASLLYSGNLESRIAIVEKIKALQARRTESTIVNTVLLEAVFIGPQLAAHTHETHPLLAATVDVALLPFPWLRARTVYRRELKEIDPRLTPRRASSLVKAVENSVARQNPPKRKRI